jgi:transcription initiation factor TFIID subunit 3
MLLGTTTSKFAESAGRIQAELDDVRVAIEHVGLVLPLDIFDDPYDNDTRGIDNLVDWFRGPQAAEMRRIAGYPGTSLVGSQSGEVRTGANNEEWLAGEL